MRHQLVECREDGYWGIKQCPHCLLHYSSEETHCSAFDCFTWGAIIAEHTPEEAGHECSQCHRKRLSTTFRSFGFGMVLACCDDCVLGS